MGVQKPGDKHARDAIPKAPSHRGPEGKNNPKSGNRTLAGGAIQVRFPMCA